MANGTAASLLSSDSRNPSEWETLNVFAEFIFDISSAWLAYDFAQRRHRDMQTFKDLLKLSSWCNV